MKLIRKSKWHSQYDDDEGKFDILLYMKFFENANNSVSLDNAICGLDFNQLGTLTASN